MKNSIITRILFSIILILIVSIIIKYDDNNKIVLQKYFYSDTFKFNKVGNFLNDKFGFNISGISSKDVSVLKSEMGNYYIDGDYTYFKDIENEVVNNIMGGVIVFSGNKYDDSTIIVQGNDGYDIHYIGIINSNYKIYDYINKGDILGIAKDTFKIKIIKDGNIINYEEYKSK